MIVIIQCAAQKRADAGWLRTRKGTPVFVVAHPMKAPTTDDYLYARPDDLSDRGVTWRQALLEYNRDREQNPLGLFPAYELYGNPIYRRLVKQFGTEKTYILSAGWGLLGASFLTPNYDITFSQSAEPYKRRRSADAYSDFCMLPASTDEPVIFFGGKDYIPLFCDVTRFVRSKKVIFYNSMHAPDAPGCSLERFSTKTRTNWQYECANTFLDGHSALATTGAR